MDILALGTIGYDVLHKFEKFDPPLFFGCCRMNGPRGGLERGKEIQSTMPAADHLHEREISGGCFPVHRGSRNGFSPDACFHKWMSFRISKTAGIQGFQGSSGGPQGSQGVPGTQGVQGAAGGIGPQGGSKSCKIERKFAPQAHPDFHAEAGSLRAEVLPEIWRSRSAALRESE